MIAEYNRKSFYWGVPGFIIQTMATFMISKYSGRGNPTLIPADSSLATLNLIRLMVLAGTILLLVGIAYYAKSRDRHWAWCLLACLPFIGIIALAFLKDKSLPKEDEEHEADRKTF